MVKKLLLSIAFSLGGLLFGLLVVEGGFRLVESRMAGAASWSDRPPFYFQHEGSPTLQDYPHQKEKQAELFRVAVVGDSYSFAPYMQFTDAFPKVLERMLNLNSTTARAEVLNFGVPGYSTSHEVQDVDRAIELQSDLVVLQVTLNDPELKPYRPTGIKEFGRFGAFTPSPLQETLFRYFHSWRFAAERLHNNHTRDEYTKYFLDLFQNPRTRSAFEAAVNEIVEKCRKAKVPIVGVVFPLFGLPLDESYPFHPIHQQVRELLSSHAVPTLDLYALYQGIPLDRLQVIPGGDRHPNEIAHRMAAEKIYEFLEEQRLIPEALLIRRRFQGRTQLIRERPYSKSATAP